MTSSSSNALRHFLMADVMAEFYDGPHATPPPADDGPIYLGIKNLTEDGHLDLRSIRHISEADFPTWTKRVEPQAGDLVFTYEASLHRYAILPTGFRGSLGRRIALIRPDPAVVDTRYLLYYFLSPQWRKTVEQRINIGSTVDRLPLVNLPDFPLALPNLDVQRRVAAAIGAYDDLIENNIRRIRILEEMVRAIYREWIVEFRFPGHEGVRLVDSEHGRIPVGWAIKPLSHFVSASRKTLDPRDDPEEPFAHFSIPAFDGGQEPIVELGGAVRSSKFEVSEPCVLYAKLNPRIPRVWLTQPHPNLRSIASTEFVILTPGATAWSLPLIWAVCSSAEFAGRVAGMAGGTSTSHQRVKPGDLMAIQVVNPEEGVAKAFADVAGDLLDLAATLRAATVNLRATRDLLLPRLLSGDLDVSSFPIDVAEQVA